MLLTVPICTVLTTAVTAALQNQHALAKSLDKTHTIPNPNSTIKPSLTCNFTCKCHTITAGYNASAVSRHAPKLPWKYAYTSYVSLPKHVPPTRGFQILETGLHCVHSSGMKTKLTTQLLAAKKYKSCFPGREVPLSWRMNWITAIFPKAMARIERVVNISWYSCDWGSGFEEGVVGEKCEPIPYWTAMVKKMDESIAQIWAVR
jgi:hypothetical protein